MTDEIRKRDVNVIGRGKPGPGRRSSRKKSQAAIDRFLDLIANGGRIHLSAYQAGHDPRTFWRWMDADPEFKAEFERVKVVGGYAMIDEAERRGVDGWDEEVFGKDGQLGTVHKYDGNLLMFAAKGRLPEYKDNPKIALLNQTNNVRYEDRSAAVSEMWRVLADAGIDANQIVEGRAVGRGASQRELPAAQDVLAEPSDVQPETSRVPRTPEP